MALKVIFLTVSKYGKYLVEIPDLNTGKLSSTNMVISALDFHPFGFSKDKVTAVDFKGVGNSYTDSKKTEEEARLETFKCFIDELTKEADDLGLNFAYILVNIYQDETNMKYPHWVISAEYQFLLKTTPSM